MLTRRLARLPESTVGALRTAAVIGRRFDAPTLALATGIDDDDLLDVVEPAEAAGLVRDVGVERFAFAHALVRDTLAAGLSATRRARVHARVAEALEDLPERATERALHWQAAGPSYVGRAWRAAVDAAAVARRRYAHEQSALLLRGALDTMAEDPDAGPRDRYDVLMQLIDAYRWSAMWPELTSGPWRRRSRSAESLGDVELTARAAIATTQGALWQSAAPGEVHEEVVAALRRSLDRLPATTARCAAGCCSSLANELYYGAPFDERRALVDEALAMARRLGDDALLLDACQIAFVSLWRASTAVERLGLGRGVTRAGRASRQRARLRRVGLPAGGRARRAGAARGDVRGRGGGARGGRAAAHPLRAARARQPAAAVAGDGRAVRRRARRPSSGSRRSTPRSRSTSRRLRPAGAFVVVASWRGDAGEAAAILQSMEGGPFPISATVVVLPVAERSGGGRA